MSDLISKESLIKSIDYIATPGGIWGKPFEAYKEAFREFVEGMPSAEKKGKWVNAYDGNDGHVKCTACFRTYDYITQAQNFNYCPNCGAKMEVEE